AYVRVLVMLTNPGAGAQDQHQSANRRYGDLLWKFRNGETDFGPLLVFQRQRIPTWGNFYPLYFKRLGLRLEETALANIAWCATRRNEYPAWMLRTCFDKHTANLLTILDPDI